MKKSYSLTEDRLQVLSDEVAEGQREEVAEERNTLYIKAVPLTITDYSSSFGELINKTKLITVHVYTFRQLAI